MWSLKTFRFRMQRPDCAPTHADHQKSKCLGVEALRLRYDDASFDLGKDKCCHGRTRAILEMSTCCAEQLLTTTRSEHIISPCSSPNLQVVHRPASQGVHISELSRNEFSRCFDRSDISFNNLEDPSDSIDDFQKHHPCSYRQHGPYP